MFWTSLRAPLAALALCLASGPVVFAQATPAAFTDSTAQGCWSFEDGSGATYCTSLSCSLDKTGFDVRC